MPYQETLSAGRDRDIEPQKEGEVPAGPLATIVFPNVDDMLINPLFLKWFGGDPAKTYRGFEKSPDDVLSQERLAQALERRFGLPQGSVDSHRLKELFFKDTSVKGDLFPG